MKISEPLYDNIINHAYEVAPMECCGIVAFLPGTTEVARVYRSYNVAEDPTVTFEMDPVDKALIGEDIFLRGWSLGGVYHSHPAGWALPSQSDLKEWKLDATRLMIIVGMDRAEPELRCYWVHDGRPVDAPLSIS